MATPRDDLGKVVPVRRPARRVVSLVPSLTETVDEELWKRVNRRIQNNPSSRTRKPRSEPGKYLLSGLMHCGHCGKSMHGTTAKGKPYYRCEATRPDYATPSVPGHPPTYTVREERVTAALDHWLSLLTSSDHLDSTVEAVLAADSKREAEPEHVCTARRRQHQLEPELDRVLAAIRAGMDPQLAAAETRKIQKELADAAATITGWEQSNGRVAPLTEDQVRRALTSAEGLTDLLKGLIPIEGVVAV